MTESLGDQCFREGFTRALHWMTKNAAPLAERELALMGEKVFRGSFGQPRILSGLVNSFLPRYGQVAAAHALRDNYLSNILRLSKQMRAIGPGHPMYSALAKQVQDATSAFRPAQRQLFTEIGSAVKPRMDFLTKTVPLSAGLAGGGALGYNIGEWRGQNQERDQISNALGEMPLMTRLKYLFNPEGTFKSSREKKSFSNIPRLGSLGQPPGTTITRSMPKMTGMTRSSGGANAFSGAGKMQPWKNTALASPLFNTLMGNRMPMAAK